MTEKGGGDKRLMIYSLLAAVMTMAAWVHGVIFDRTELIMDILVPTSFLCLGMMMKFGDQAYDADVYPRRTALLLAFPGGVWLGSLMAVDTGSATIFMGVLLGLLCARKLDNQAFLIGAATATVIEVFALFSGIGTISLAGAVLVTVFAFVDEKANDLPWVDNGRGWKAVLFHNRPFLKAAVLLLCLAGLLPSLMYFFAFLAFDLGYSAVEAFSLKGKEVPYIG